MELEKVLTPKVYLRMWPKSIEDQFDPVRYIENGYETRLFLELRQFRPDCFFTKDVGNKVTDAITIDYFIYNAVLAAKTIQ